MDVSFMFWKRFKRCAPDQCVCFGQCASALRYALSLAFTVARTRLVLPALITLFGPDAPVGPRSWGCSPFGSECVCVFSDNQCIVSPQAPGDVVLRTIEQWLSLLL